MPIIAAVGRKKLRARPRGARPLFTTLISAPSPFSGLLNRPDAMSKPSETKRDDLSLKMPTALSLSVAVYQIAPDARFLAWKAAAAIIYLWKRSNQAY